MKQHSRTWRFCLALLALSLAFAAASYFPSRAVSLPESAYISGLTGHPQGYNLSCESRSAVDWAVFWGVEIGESEFLGQLPRSDNPDKGFVGHPNDPWGFTPPYSYGVHAGPIAKQLRAYGLNADAQRGLRWKQLRVEIAAGRPVIVWVIGQMWPGQSREYMDASGRTTTVAPYEHTMILVGYDPLRVQVIDAYSGQTNSYAISAFLSSWSVLGNMAVLMIPEEEQETPTPAPTSAAQAGEAMYIVQPGDYLVAIAEQHNTTWKVLAELNDIPYPYTLSPCQGLRLPDTSTAQEPAGEEEISSESLSDQPVSGLGEDSYIVQPGDYLKSIADRAGLDWRALAELNGIVYPYVIQAGQELRLK